MVKKILDKIFWKRRKIEELDLEVQNLKVRLDSIEIHTIGSDFFDSSITVNESKFDMNEVVLDEKNCEAKGDMWDSKEGDHG